MSIEISNSHPAPEQNSNPKTRKGRKGDGRQKVILALEVGQSFHINTSIKSASGLRHWAKARHPHRDFTAQADLDGVRIWRTK